MSDGQRKTNLIKIDTPFLESSFKSNYKREFTSIEDVANKVEDENIRKIFNNEEVKKRLKDVNFSNDNERIYHHLLGNDYVSLFELTFIKEPVKGKPYEGIIANTFGYNKARKLYIHLLWAFENPLDFVNKINATKVFDVKIYFKNFDSFIQYKFFSDNPINNHIILMDEIKKSGDNFLIYPTVDSVPLDCMMGAPQNF